MTEAARRLGTSSHALQMLKKRHPEGFPLHDENVVGVKVYRWLELRHWYMTRKELQG